MCYIIKRNWYFYISQIILMFQTFLGLPWFLTNKFEFINQWLCKKISAVTAQRLFYFWQNPWNCLCFYLYSNTAVQMRRLCDNCSSIRKIIHTVMLSKQFPVIINYQSSEIDSRSNCFPLLSLHWQHNHINNFLCASHIQNSFFIIRQKRKTSSARPLK